MAWVISERPLIDGAKTPWAAVSLGLRHHNPKSGANEQANRAKRKRKCREERNRLISTLDNLLPEHARSKVFKGAVRRRFSVQKSALFLDPEVVFDLS